MNKKATSRSTLQAFLYLLPMLIFISVFTVYPIIKSIMMSFYDNYNLFTGDIGGYSLSNYQTLFSDPAFYTALKNTFIYVAGVVPLSIAISLGIALMLYRIPFLKGLFRTVYFLPYVTSTVAISIVWSWLYHSRYGLFNYFLNLVGIESIDWLLNPKYALLSVIIMAIWKSLGFNILLLLVGLGNINDNYYKAAKIDGAGAWQRFWHITLPMLRPTLFLLSTIGVINSFKVFDQVFALFNGRPGPANSATTVVYYLFYQFYQRFDYGLAAASGVALFGIILFFTFIQFLGNQYLNKRSDAS